MSPELLELIRESQSGLIKGRNILNGIVISHALIHLIEETILKGFLMKLKFEKAYDNIN